MIESVRKAMKILSVLSDAKGGAVPLSEISERCAYPKPTCSHILKVLCLDGYALRISHTEGYTLGPQAYYLTRHGRYEEELIALCRPVMRFMEHKSGATVVLSVIRNSDKFIIDCVDNTQNMFTGHAKIRTDDIYRTATGRAILAEMTPDAVRAVYEKHGAPPEGHWDEVSDLESLLKELAVIRKQKIVTTLGARSESDSVATGVAVPIFRKRRCVGAVGLAVWKNAMAASELEALKRILVKGAAEIQRRLNFESSASANI